MKLQFIAAESFGVRSMCAVVETPDDMYLLDPGVALAPKRFGLPPHPAEIEAAKAASKRISKAGARATKIIITHYHHDHFSPFYHHQYNEVDRKIYEGKKIFLKSPQNAINYNQKKRAKLFIEKLNKSALTFADNVAYRNLEFSPAVTHGEKSRGVYVIMVAIKTDSATFIHASDTQSVGTEGVKWILSKKPDIVFISGPPIYISGYEHELAHEAVENLKMIASTASNLIIDHHLLREKNFMSFLEPVYEKAEKTGCKIQTAASYMGAKNLLLEAHRKELYETSQ